jgi:pilus assembly protein CpaF
MAQIDPAAWMDRFLRLAQKIELIIQSKANENRLSVSDATGKEQIRQLIRSETEGLVPKDLRFQLALQDYIGRSMFGLGPLDPLLEDPNVEEIIVNGPRAIFAGRTNGAHAQVLEGFYDEDHLRRIAERIANASNGGIKSIDPALGIQDYLLPGGIRAHLIHNEITPRNCLLLNIRKPIRNPVDCGKTALTDQLAGYLQSGATILISGLPGSGKTTFARSLLSRVDPRTRIVIAEEVGETIVSLPNVAHLHTRIPRAGRDAIDLRRLVTAFLRMAPDIAVVGEIRDTEALPFILTISSGVTGVSTIHGRQPRAALRRLLALARLATGNNSADHLVELISDGLDLVVQLRREGARFMIEEIAAVEDPIRVDGSLQFVTNPLRTDPLAGTLIPTRDSRFFERFPSAHESNLIRSN